MPKYVSGAAREGAPDNPEPRPVALPDPEGESSGSDDRRRAELVALFRGHPRAQSLEEILSGATEIPTDQEEAEALADHVVRCHREPAPDPGIIEAIQVLREAGIRFPDDAIRGPLKPIRAEEGIFANPTTLNDLLSYDVEHDPNTVLGERWLCRGGSLILVSQSGIGKSSLMAQLAIGWSLARPDLTFGIEPIRPLTQLIIQAENDMGDLAEPAQGIFSGFGLTDADRASAQSRIEWHHIVGSKGADFLAALTEELTARHERGETVDICWIDPLHNFFGDDISSFEKVSAFTGALDVIGKDLGTIFCIVHHTPKPPKEEADLSPTDLAYAGFGSSGLTNWAREIMVVMRAKVAESEPPTFTLTACKRRLRAGMTTIAPEGEGGSGIPTAQIYIRHASDGSILWQQCAKPESGGGRTTGGRGSSRPVGAKKPLGRPSSLTDAQRLDIADAVSANGGDPRISPEALDKLARKLGKTTRTVRNYLNKVAEKRERAREELIREGAIKGGDDAERERADAIADALGERFKS